MTSVANPDRTTVDLVSKPLVVEEHYAVINNPDAVDALIAENPHLQHMAERINEPLFGSLIPGPALRFMRWTNEMNPNRDLGPSILVHRTVTYTPWRTINEEEQATIDDGRRPNG